MFDNYLRYRDSDKRTALYLLILAATVEEIVELLFEIDEVEHTHLHGGYTIEDLNKVNLELADVIAMFNFVSDILDEMEYSTNLILDSRLTASMAGELIHSENETPGFVVKEFKRSLSMLAKHLCKMARFGPNSPQPSTGLLTKVLISREYYAVAAAAKAYLKLRGHPTAAINHAAVSEKIKKFDSTLIESFTSDFTVIPK